VSFLCIAVQICGKMISQSDGISNIDISRELVLTEKICCIHYTDNGQSLYRDSGDGLPRLAFQFSPSCHPCSALPNSSSIIVSHQSLYRSHVSLGSWSCLFSFLYDIYLTAVGLTPGGNSTVHIYRQTIHRTTQSTQNNT
jgi:hypothetical protein